MNDYDTVLIRFNTKWQDDSKRRKWRVVINGFEYLASQVHIRVDCDSIEEPINGEPKFHMLCFGYATWKDDEVWIGH